MQPSSQILRLSNISSLFFYQYQFWTAVYSHLVTYKGILWRIWGCFESPLVSYFRPFFKMCTQLIYLYIYVVNNLFMEIWNEWHFTIIKLATEKETDKPLWKSTEFSKFREVRQNTFLKSLLIFCLWFTN